MPRDILQLDLSQVDPKEIDEIYKGAIFNVGLGCEAELAIAEVAIKVDKNKMHSKKKKGEGYDPLFKMHAQQLHSN